MHAQESGGAGQQDVLAQRLRLAGERFERVVRKQFVDGRVVIFLQFAVGKRCTGRFGFVARQMGGQCPGGRIDEDFAVAEFQAAFLGFDQDVGHHQRGTAQVEEVVECADAFQVEHLREDFAERAFGVVFRLHVVFVC